MASINAKGRRLDRVIFLEIMDINMAISVVLNLLKDCLQSSYMALTCAIIYNKMTLQDLPRNKKLIHFFVKLCWLIQEIGWKSRKEMSIKKLKGWETMSYRKSCCSENQQYSINIKSELLYYFIPWDDNNKVIYSMNIL